MQRAIKTRNKTDLNDKARWTVKNISYNIPNEIKKILISAEAEKFYNFTFCSSALFYVLCITFFSISRTCLFRI